MLVQVHHGMLDVYELVLATTTSYGLLRRHFANSDVLTFLRDLVREAALDIESIANAVSRKRASFPDISYKAEIQAIEQEILRFDQENADDHAANEALAVLRASYNKLCELVGMIGQLHGATQAP